MRYTKKNLHLKIPSDTKEYVLKRLYLLDDIGFHKNITHIGSIEIKSYTFDSINGIKLSYPWEIDYDFSRFNVQNLSDDYGEYQIIKGKFLYSRIIGNESRTHHGLFRDYTVSVPINKITGGSFSIGFINSSTIYIFKKRKF